MATQRLRQLHLSSAGPSRIIRNWLNEEPRPSFDVTVFVGRNPRVPVNSPRWVLESTALEGYHCIVFPTVPEPGYSQPGNGSSAESLQRNGMCRLVSATLL